MGRYLFLGIDVGLLSRDERARLRRHFIGFVFQGFNLLARTSAVENVELPLIYRGMPLHERRRRAMDALRQVGLEGREGHSASELSGGQQQRVAIARAIVTEPVVLLADEPTGNLDTKTSREIMDLLTRLNRERGITVIMVTHELEMADYARRVIRFVDGRVDERPPERGTGLMLQETVKLALQAIRRNAFRSFLTVLGIVIGVAAVIAMVTIGHGTTAKVTADLSKLGSNLLFVRPGQSTMGPSRAGSDAKAFNVRDIAALREQLYGARAVTPIASRSQIVVFGTENWRTTVTGTDDAYLHLPGLAASDGAAVLRQRAARRAGCLHHRRDGAARAVREPRARSARRSALSPSPAK